MTLTESIKRELDHPKKSSKDLSWVLYYSRRGVRTFAYFGIVLVWLMGLPVSILFAFIAAGALALLSHYYISKIEDNERRFTITSQGITLQKAKWGFIPWEDIEAVWMSKQLFASYIHMRLRYADKYLRQLNSIQRVSSNPNNAFGSGHIQIVSVGLIGKLEDIYDHIAYLNSSGQISILLGKNE